MARLSLQLVIALVMSCQGVCIAAASGNVAADPPAADKPAYRIHIEDQALAALVITGTHTVKADSRWHKGQIVCDVRGRLGIEPDQLARLLPDKPAAVGQSWTAPDKLAGQWAQQLHDAIKLQPRDQAAWQKWTGGKFNAGRRESTPTEATKPSGSLRLAFEKLEQKNDHRRAVIRIKGELTVHCEGRLANRYGPNSFDYTWRLPIEGTLAIDLNEGAVAGLTLTARGTVKGKYFTAGQGDKFDEPFEAPTTLRLDLPLPPTPRLARQVATLVAQLADDDFTKRQSAHRALAKLGPSIEPLLKQHLRRAKDAEVKWRLGKLVERLAR